MSSATILLSALSLKGPITTAVDNISKYIYIFFLKENKSIFHVNQCHLLQILLRALRVKGVLIYTV